MGVILVSAAAALAKVDRDQNANVAMAAEYADSHQPKTINPALLARVGRIFAFANRREWRCPMCCISRNTSPCFLICVQC